MEALFKFLVLPSGLLVICLLGALACAPWRGTRRLAGILAGAAGMLYLVFGSGPVAHLLLGGLESRYSMPDPMPEVEQIVVLAAFGEYHPRVTAVSRVNSHSLARLVEAARLAREYPRAMVMVTGGGEVPELMADVLRVLGIGEDRIRVDVRSDSTAESALRLAPELRDVPFALVTSAGHMPRAMMVFGAQGLEPIPVPTDYQAYSPLRAVQLFPTPGQFLRSELAVHEYLALAWYRWRGLDAAPERR